MRIFIISIFAILFFTNCEKKDEIGKTIIKGQVKDFFTNKPIKDIKLSIDYKESVFSSSSHEYVSSITDSMGNYYLEFDISDDIEISSKVEVQANYSCMESDDKPCEFSYVKGEMNTIDLYLFPISTLRLTLVNKPPKNNNDSIYYEVKDNLIFKEKPISQYIIGKDSISFEYRVFGNDTTLILWEASENGYLVKDSIEILINDIDTIEYSIYY
jgi:hypothetical protein